MAGEVCLVTGANSGLGFATATALVSRGAAVIVASRNEERGRDACARIRNQVANDDVRLEIIDLSSLSSIRAAVERIAVPRIDVLIHHAGLLQLERSITPEGQELTLATHLVGPHLLFRLLAERLAGQRTVVHAMHPGWAATPGVESSLPRFWQRMQNRLRSPEEGADTIVWLAVAQRAADSTGLFWFDRQPVSTHLLPWTRESAAERSRLWAMCEESAGP